MKKYTSQKDNFKYIIEEDLPEMGVYLYIYENGKCIKDELQSDISICMNIAFEEYGIGRDSWVIQDD